MPTGRGEDDAQEALQRELSGLDGDPTCALCRAGADFFLFDPGRVAKFVCWEHVSPVSAAVDVPVAESNKPIAVPLSEEFS